MRLSEDDGPPAHLFLGDDEDQDGDIGDDDEIGSIRRNASRVPPPVELQTVTTTRDEVTDYDAVPPAPPPKDRIRGGV